MCKAGARWVQKEILDANPEANIRVYSIWFDMLSRDDRNRSGIDWDAELLTDPRVIQIWDSTKLVGQFFSREVGFKSGPIAWDVYYLYGTDSRRDTKPSQLVSSGYTIISNRKRLADQVARLMVQ